MDFVEPFAMKKAAKKYIFTLAITQMGWLTVLAVSTLLVSLAIRDTSKIGNRMGLEELTRLVLAVTLENGKMANGMAWASEPTLTVLGIKDYLFKINS